MSKYGVLIEYKGRISKYHEKINEYKKPLTEEEVRESRKIAEEYYESLIKMGVAYGKAAIAIIREEEGFGKFGNLHLVTRAHYEGIHENEVQNIQNNLVVRLVHSDVEMRLKKITEPVAKGEYRQIADYHYAAYEIEGLSNHAWGGALFEEFVGSGSWMRFIDKTVKYQIKDNVLCAIFKGVVKNEVNAKEAYNALLNTEKIERGLEYIRQDERNWGEINGAKYYIGEEDISFWDTFLETSSSNSIYEFIDILKESIFNFEVSGEESSCLEKSSDGKGSAGSIFEESKDVIDVLDMFDTPAMQNSKLTNNKRFEILRQQSVEKGNLQYAEMFEDMLDRHESVFEALDMLIENQEKNDGHGGEL
jgi:hypothetical protein